MKGKRMVVCALIASFYLAGLCRGARRRYKLKKSRYNLHYIPGLNAKLYIDKGTVDGIKLQLQKGIYWEGNIGDLIAKNTRRGSTVVDAGSHIGIHTIRMARATGKGGRVYSFEPQKKLYVEQKENLRVNKIRNVTLMRKALGERSQVIQMCPYNSTNEGGQLVGKGGDTARMITLDSLNLQNVSLIKADVEYYEYFLFQGARDTIQRCRPVIIFELLDGEPYDICPEHMKTEHRKSKELIESYGYNVHLIHGADYIAFPKERGAVFP